jgi:hypothetical protein
MAAAADHGIGALTTRIAAIATVAKDFEALNVLAEADKLGLQVLREVLSEAFRMLGKRGELSATQAKHLKAAAKALIDAGDDLANSPSPEEIAKWWRGVEPAAREFARAVLDLPYR